MTAFQLERCCPRFGLLAVSAPSASRSALGRPDLPRAGRKPT
ncbi:hypothetical protein KCH_01480 [Kitasatospora cheerisanensis KCTC 2395]|uniref:Uncharacterized protein n=1 Tax=Kitasatospora cheerisanensis KCTC 2395 TaxID=1348663 RepID=A0A066ZCM8_9ACTN|nr:hypothetical protein KCH_01480 [Kitasatospora cheerisanensis KCTC 2395]